MERTKGVAAPESGTTSGVTGDQADELTIEEIMADPEIAPLLGFEPVVRKVKRGNGWTPDIQRKFVALTAWMGSRTRAAEALGREVAGASKLCRSAGGESFADACDAALDLYANRKDVEASANRGRAWAEPLRARASRSARIQAEPGPLPGQVRNEYGEWEDEDSLQRRGEEAVESIATKLLRCRRMFLLNISGSAGKRAAFEMLTELPIDWDKAAKMEPQDHEPWRKPNMREADMVLTAENGWMHNIVPYGPDKIGELRREIDGWREEQGLPAIDWDAD